MEKKINSKALVISLIIALISCAVLFNYIRNLQKPVEEIPKISLLVASRNIEAGELITNAEISVVKVSADSLPSGIINERTEIEGRYAGQSIIMGEAFRKQRLSTKEELSLSWNIPKDMRAVSVFVNEDSIFSNQLRSGDRVDVVGSFKKETQDGKIIASSMIIIQDAEVLSIGSERFVQGDTGNQSEKSSSDPNSLPRTVTLAVNTQDAEKLVFTTDFGDFSLILRGNGDHFKTNTRGIVIDDVTPFIIESP